MSTHDVQAHKAGKPQQVRWGPSDGKAAGITIWDEMSDDGFFMPWNKLRKELGSLLLPQLFANPKGFRFEKHSYHEKPDWLVWIVDEKDERYCDVWFGGNPEKDWAFDGLIHFGDADSPPHVWQSYQRHSDGTYRRLPSLCSSLDRDVVSATVSAHSNQ